MVSAGAWVEPQPQCHITIGSKRGILSGRCESPAGVNVKCAGRETARLIGLIQEAQQQRDVMKKKSTVAIVALLAGPVMLADQDALAGDCCDGDLGKSAIYASSKVRTKGWIELHRPDGEVVHIKIDQIVFVMSATNTGANKRAQSKIQLVNGFADVLESVDEVMQSIKDNDLIT
jgi:hypothetical protein